MTIKDTIKHNPKLKKIVHACMMHPVKARPRWWLRHLQFLYIKRGKGSVIYRSVRRDITPFNRCVIGSRSVVESFSCLNNAVGDLIIGNDTRIGLCNTVIGPVNIGNHVNIAQNVVITGLNHRFHDVARPIDEQGIETKAVTVEDDVWIGAGAIVLPGVTIGKHSVVAAGSVVTRSVPPLSVCAGNPARIVKQYNSVEQKWM